MALVDGVEGAPTLGSDGTPATSTDMGKAAEEDLPIDADGADASASDAEVSSNIEAETSVTDVEIYGDVENAVPAIDTTVETKIPNASDAPDVDKEE